MKTGDRVVCINDKHQGFGGLVRGDEYDISGFDNDGDLFLFGLVIPVASYAWRFRKLESHKATVNEVNFKEIEETLEEPKRELV
jgi:hypothetical protein